MIRSTLVILFAFWTIPFARAQSFEYSVRHKHVLQDCHGTLKVGPEGVEYLASRPKDSRKWKFNEIRTLEVLSPTKISLVTYEDQKRWAGKDKVFEFVLLDKQATPELTAFLLGRVKKPMELAVVPEEKQKPAFEMRVKHLHTITGAMGVLRIYPDRIIFLSSAVGDSRDWRFADVERVSQPDRFRFQLVSFAPKAGGPTEVYNFQLLDDLPAGLLDYLWVRFHPSTYYPGTPR